MLAHTRMLQLIPIREPPAIATAYRRRYARDMYHLPDDTLCYALAPRVELGCSGFPGSVARQYLQLASFLCPRFRDAAFPAAKLDRRHRANRPPARPNHPRD